MIDLVNSKRTRTLIERTLGAAVISLLLFVLPALAADLEPSQRVALMQRAVEGDLAALAAMEDDEEGGEEPGRWGSFYRGFAFHAAGRDADAVAAWQQAARLGHNTAPSALAWHHYEREQWLEAYAWARVAMEVEAALRDLQMDDLQGSWTLHTAVQAAESLDQDLHADADARARQYLAEYLDALVGEDLVNDGQRGYRTEDVVDRRRPTFPRSMWENGRPGWAYVYFEIRADGKVGEIATLGASHPRFGRAAARAVKQWRFEPEAFDDLPSTGLQRIDFNLRR